MTKQKRCLVLGAGGFIGNHLVERLKSEGCHVIGIDLKYPEFNQSSADEFLIRDLRNPESFDLVNFYDEVYQLAADMGGAGYINTGEHDADVMVNSALINMNLLSKINGDGKVFFSSSACVYPEANQIDRLEPNCREDSVYPANPDTEYGWEKLFAERAYLAAHRAGKIDARIARFHNVYGPLGTYDGGKEKAPAALCRKVAGCGWVTKGEIEIWGDGKQTRSFLYIDDCIDAILLLMRSDFTGPVNIGSERLITINTLAEMVIGFSGKNIKIKHIPGPQGVRGRVSQNDLIREKLNWEPKFTLEQGMQRTYEWIDGQINQEPKNAN